jgi:hypothetical protein
MTNPPGTTRLTSESSRDTARRVPGYRVKVLSAIRLYTRLDLSDGLHVVPKNESALIQQGQLTSCPYTVESQ